jgi:uncharacterized surface protein with fasciclin (FAS1) repeats
MVNFFDDMTTDYQWLEYCARITLHQPRSFTMKKYCLNIMVTALIAAGTGPAIAADIVDTATTSGSFKIFVAAVKAAGFNETLKASGPYTVFAPTDEAFGKLPPGTWDAIAKDKVKLSKVLAYHVIPGKVLVAEVKPGKVKTTEGDFLTLKSDNGKVTVNEANVTESDVVADNGVIHAIDAVVLPPN